MTRKELREISREKVSELRFYVTILGKEMRTGSVSDIRCVLRQIDRITGEISEKLGA